MQVVLGTRGYPVTLARPFSPGVYELTFQIPADALPGTLPVHIFAGGFFSRMPVMLPIA